MTAAMGSYGLGIDPPSEFGELSTREKQTLLAWIGYAMRPGKSPDWRTSYGIKHAFEQESGLYISNGQFKGAMLRSGYKPLDPRERNWTFRARVCTLTQRQQWEIKQIAAGERARWAHPGTAEAGGSSMKRDKPGDDAVLEALEALLMDNPYLRGAPIEEVARRLMLGGYLESEPSLGVVGAAMATVVAEEQAFGPDVPLEDV